MMVEQAPFTKSAGQLMSDLNQARIKLEEISGKPQVIFNHDSYDFIEVLNRLNNTLDPVVWEGKKAIFEGMLKGIDEKITSALDAIQVFQRHHLEKDPKTQRNIEQAITSLAFTLRSVLNSFDKNLRDLKKHRIGQRVEKTSKSKST